MSEHRRLAAILAADVAGYSKLIGRDEESTLAQLHALRKDVIEPQIAKHSGRLFKSVGDGFLVEFASAVQAVTAAQAIQQANVGGSLPLRIGIHVGDVVVEGDDLLGDGVNVAARVEGIADPSGILVTRAVHEQVRDKLEVSFVDKGEIALKNLTRPVQVFALGRATPTSGREPASPLPLPDKPSIAVLPFQNMSGDPEQEYFADGIVEDIITALSRNKQLFVIARNSSFAYKGRSPDVRQVGRELGVRYVLEGSVRKSGNRMRIAGQLVDASTGMHIWADRYDGELNDIFELQDLMASSVIGGILPMLDKAEIERAKRKIGDLQAYDYFLRSSAVPMTAEGTTEGLALARRAILMDPTFALGYARIASLLNRRRSFGWSVDRRGEDGEAEESIRRALELDSNDARVLTWCGQTMVMNLYRAREGAALLDAAISIDPNFSNALIFRGSARIAQDRFEEAIRDVERGLRLSPLDPSKFYGLTLLGRAHTLCDRYENALPLLVEALRLRPNFASALMDLAVAHTRAGDLQSARKSMAAYKVIMPNMTIELFKRRAPHLSASGVEVYVNALRLSGLPE